MRWVVALALAVAAFAIGSSQTRHLPVGNDAGFGVLFVAAVFAALATVFYAWREARRGRPPLRSALRGMGVGITVLVVAMAPVVLFVIYCFTPLNPNAPCLS